MGINVFKTYNLQVINGKFTVFFFFDKIDKSFNMTLKKIRKEEFICIAEVVEKK